MEIPLCSNCLIKGYEEFLGNRIKKSLSFLKKSPFMLFGGIAGILFIGLIAGYLPLGKSGFLGLPWGPNLGKIGLGLLFLIAAGFLVYGIIGIPIESIKYLKRSRILRNVRQNGTMPMDERSKAFLGEAERILKEMEAKNGEHMMGSFELPKFRGRDEIPGNTENPIVECNFKQVRKIINVAHSVEELRRIIPNDWKKMLEKVDVSVSQFRYKQ